ncbi:MULTISPECIES: hypothetical protein [unclassified Rhodanobacter]|uniref:hypothetical protein n=1 Tax=unclassified Rhodanobacter TaxID=2621553 RepID=UPI001BDE3101|nr:MULTISPECIES: hypothetical protein [unclassified Rhodanobacter]MBT2143261.1 hypothetical protein [Rhodanobacter sp. LX-99]MBT2147665.1 hypothetical protein [Rhodanobacter sp. LX-100]
MITAGTLAAKIASFIAGKAATHIGSLALDKRRKACRALTKLYFCVSALDEAGADILVTFEGFRSDSNAFSFPLMNALNNHMHEVAHATNMFVDLGYELEAGLRIIDPALAATCHTLYRGKFDFLLFLSNCISWDRQGEKSKIIVKFPTGKLDEVDLEVPYRESQMALGSGEKVYWPESALDDFRAGFEDVSIEWDDENTARRVHEMLVSQKTALEDARERLRRLLSEKFSVHEILFQSDSHPYR